MRILSCLFAILLGCFGIQAVMAGGMEVAPKDSGFYLTADVGGASFQEQRPVSTGISPGAQAVTQNEISRRSGLSFTWAAGIGWQFNSLFRIDVMYTYLSFPLVNHAVDIDNSALLSTQLMTLTGRSDVVLLNAYIDLLSLFGYNAAKLRPYIGAGVGYAENKTKNTVFQTGSLSLAGFVDPAHRSDFAYRVLAGFMFPITHELRIFGQYSFVCAGKYVLGQAFNTNAGSNIFSNPAKFNIHSSVFSAGLTYLF